jgi:hypothetical protein
VLSEESWFPQWSTLNNLRLRSAWGQAGVQPSTIAALQFLNTNTVPLRGTEVGALRLGAIGNSDVRPEVTTETETGFDAELFSNRASRTSVVSPRSADTRERPSIAAGIDAPPNASSVGATSALFASAVGVAPRGINRGHGRLRSDWWAERQASAAAHPIYLRAQRAFHKSLPAATFRQATVASEAFIGCSMTRAIS